MPLFNFDVQNSISGILSRTSALTGINNLSRTSTLRLFAESVSNDLELVNINNNSTATQFTSDTATGVFLDKIAQRNGL